MHVDAILLGRHHGTTSQHQLEFNVSRARGVTMLNNYLRKQKEFSDLGWDAMLYSIGLHKRARVVVHDDVEKACKHVKRRINDLVLIETKRLHQGEYQHQLDALSFPRPLLQDTLPSLPALRVNDQRRILYELCCEPD